LVLRGPGSSLVEGVKDPSDKYFEAQRKKEKVAHKRQARAELEAKEDKEIARALEAKPMRSESDVVERIRHDESIESSRFTIGHLDRFHGMQETAFDTFFSHEDYVDIPLHRIRYIKFHDEIVWDRNNKIDHVFGSTPGARKIHDFIAKQDEYAEAQKQREEREEREERRRRENPRS